MLSPAITHVSASLAGSAADRAVSPVAEHRVEGGAGQLIDVVTLASLFASGVRGVISTIADGPDSAVAHGRVVPAAAL